MALAHLSVDGGAVTSSGGGVARAAARGRSVVAAGDLGRPARARWLSGRRSDTECWDAYEAIDGQPLLELLTKAQPWARVRHWLADLARELADALKDGSLPALHVDRIWIGSDDRVRLLDWLAPGTNPDSRSSTLDPRSLNTAFRSTPW